MSVREADNPELYAHIQQQNLLRQYDLLTNCVEICLSKGIDAFDKYMLWSLNAAAVSNIAQFGGRFREQPIYVGDHIPPHFEKVPGLVDQCLSVIHETWTINDHPTILPAYALWRLNWIHPFIEGNGPHGTSSLLLVDLSQTGKVVTGQEDRARAYSREPAAVLRRTPECRSPLG
jgi:fido (protein-threonine AMPylation protein)